MIQINENPQKSDNDWLLEDINLSLNKQKLELAITIQVSGMVISGILISGYKYFEALSISSDNNKESFAKLAENIYSEAAIATAVDNGQALQWLHFKDVNIYAPGAIQPLIAKSWRCNVKNVIGFTLGMYGPEHE